MSITWLQFWSYFLQKVLLEQLEISLQMSHWQLAVHLTFTGGLT